MKVLSINSSSNRQQSTSTAYGEKLIARLKSNNSNVEVVQRHTTYSNLPFVNEDMLSAFFSKSELTEEEIEASKVSNELVEELQSADVIVITAPIYNFSVPASLKAYFDLVARAGLTFKYTENGPEGLLTNKKAYVVVSSGGTEIGSDIDFAGKYIVHYLRFLGISDIEVIKLDQMMFKAEEKERLATEQIHNLIVEEIA